ncbi:MAG: CARDB domain-containing protein, partial [Euryarchaeota archaeon]|nr:CARDB domain-containing protein [Euryarchaeota archaeon]
ETAMGALVIYCQNNGINVHIALGEYLVQIGNDPADNNNWKYAVNEVVPQVGGAQKAIADGDRVHWYNYKLHYYEVLTTLDTTELLVGGDLTATVTWKNMTGTHPLSGASVYVGALGPGGLETGTHVGTTGADGTCTFSWSNQGEWGVYAVDPVHGSGQYNIPYVSFTCRTEEKPDLVINKTVSFSDSTFTVNYTLTNIGIGRANESTTCKYLDGVLMECQTCPALDSGESHNGTFDPEPCPCGSIFNVTVCADRDNVINESDETNNCEVNIITCPSTTRVDIQADGIAGTIFDVSGYSICPGTVTEDGVTINNETAMGAVVIYCQNNGINVQITIGSWGEYLLQIGNDPADNNNWMYAVNEVAPPIGGAQKAIADGDRVHWYNYKLHYYVVLITLDKTEIEVGGNLTATVSWKDMCGTHPLKGASVYVGAMGSGGPEPGTHVGTTGADGTCTFSWYEPGEWGVYAVDPVHGSGQYNMPYVSFTCRTGGKPDLVINKTVSISNSTFTVNYTLTNIGIVRANESTTCKYLDSVLMESQSCPALDPSESHNGTFDPEPCPCGSIFNVSVCADNNNAVNESDETNNCEVSIVECPPCKPDLVVEKTVTLEDGNFTVNYTVTNIGIDTAEESTTCKYLDGERKESQACPPLGPGESYDGTFLPESCPCGATLNVTVCADNDNDVDESDETNNCEVNIIECPSTKVDLRVEGMAGTIFNAPGYSICPGTVTEDGFTIDNETAMGALVIYCQENDINVEILIFSIGLYILQIGTDQADYNNWMYAINEVPPQVGGDVKTIVDGDRVH